MVNTTSSHGNSQSDSSKCHCQKTKLIIDTDPGIDDAMAILMAFQIPEIEVLGLSTVFGNVYAPDATRNALFLCELAERTDVPVAEGSSHPLKRKMPAISDFVHGKDGLGNTHPPKPKTKKIEKSACEFLVDTVSEHPGEVTILALGPLTNIALAIEKDKTFTSKLKKIVVLGGAFFVPGNITPAAEANILADPEAADFVFTSGAEILVVGINITLQVMLSEKDLQELKDSCGQYGEEIYKITDFYRKFYLKSDGVNGIFLHDPTCLTAIVRPDFFEYKKGVVRVATEGICTGHTIVDFGLKKWNSENAWTGHKPISVAWTVKVPEVAAYVKQLLEKP